MASLQSMLLDSARLELEKYRYVSVAVSAGLRYVSQKLTCTNHRATAFHPAYFCCAVDS
jgi:hypothetical protein